MKMSFRGYIRFLRRQHVNIQHAHAFFFAFVITMFLASIILYFEYGFFRTRYDKNEVVYEEEARSQQIEAPGVMIGNFFSETKHRLSKITSSSSSFFTGKETFQR